jgi:hypothetical protein
LADYIPDTVLLNVRLGFYRRALGQALELNERKLVQTPYTAICLTHLPDDEKSKHCNLPKLDENPSKEAEIAFAGGILANLSLVNTDLPNLVVSFLPLMSMKRAEELQRQAQEYHGQGLQIEHSEVHFESHTPFTLNSNS